MLRPGVPRWAVLVFGVLHASALVSDCEDAKDAWVSASYALVMWEDWDVLQSC